MSIIQLEPARPLSVRSSRRGARLIRQRWRLETLPIIRVLVAEDRCRKSTAGDQAFPTGRGTREGRILAKRLPLHKLRRHETHTVDFHRVNRDDMRMIERRRGASVLLEAMKALGISREAGLGPTASPHVS